MATKNIKVLGVETSCDDTAAALLEIKGGRVKILSNVLSSQVKIHAKYGGVYPMLAKREHQKNLPHVFKKALQLARCKVSDINIIGVTAGPGLEPCLWQGINFAKEVSQEYKKPLISVNHIEAHMLANFIKKDLKSVRFPAVCLVVSGGHTQLILMKKIGEYKLIGETRDDAAGECLDKVARILGLGYPGGPAIARCAEKSRKAIKPFLPRPMIRQKNYDFSFSGLKTAVLYRVKERNYDTIEMCQDVQQAVIDVLLYKTIKAAKNFKAKSIILGGGVTANSELKKQLKRAVKKEIPSSKLYIPDFEFCTDNAVMIALTAFYRRREKTKDIKADGLLSI